jgi:hypothetical protein
MAMKYFDRVKGTTSTTGTGDYTIDVAAATGYYSFASALGTGDECYYCVEDGTDWEVCKGTFNDSGDTMTRDTVLASSNSGSAVNWGAGDKDIYMVMPAERMSQLHGFQIESIPGLAMPVASGTDAIAIGDNAQAIGNQSVAIGETAIAGVGSADSAAIAIGWDSYAYDTACIAIGDDAKAGESGSTLGPYSVAIGYVALADRTNSTALGPETEARGASAVAVGYTANAKEQNNIAIGNGAVAGQSEGSSTESDAIAIGDADAMESKCIAIGDGAISGDQTTSNSPGSVAIGPNTKAGNNSNDTPTAPYCVAVGYAATAYDTRCTALGPDAVAGNVSGTGDSYATAVGYNAEAISLSGAAIGHQATCFGDYAFAGGYDADAREEYCVAVGDSQAGQSSGGTTNEGAVAIGRFAVAYEARSVALGRSATAGSSSGSNYPDSVAIGSEAECTGQESVALGHAASCITAHFSVAIGADTDADGDYNIAIGNLGEVRERYGIGIGYSVRTGQDNDGTTHPNIVAIGYDNTVYEGYANVIGSSNTVGAVSGNTAQYNTVIGHDCTIDGKTDVVAVGRGITATRSGEHLYGINPSDIDYRRGHAGFAIQTTDATPTKLKVNFDGLDYWGMGTSSGITFSILVVGMSTSADEYASYQIDGFVYRGSGDPTVTSTVNVISESDAALDCTVGVDTTNDGLYIEVTGKASSTIKWVADMRFAEIEH